MRSHEIFVDKYKFSSKELGSIMNVISKLLAGYDERTSLAQFLKEFKGIVGSKVEKKKNLSSKIFKIKFLNYFNNLCFNYSTVIDKK
jgi:hypothetical protein